MKPEPIAIDEEYLFEYLYARDKPVAENEIINQFTPDNHSLFIRHFSVYHALYKLKFNAGHAGYYLHLDCMRIRLISIPPAGYCGHYHSEKGTFCGTETYGNYCDEHLSEHEDYSGGMTYDILRDFYLDPGNITFGESQILKKLMTGVKVYCVKKREIDEALELFGITRPDRKNITSRYRELAVKYHPDRLGTQGDMMKKINSSYAVLKEVYIL